MNASKAIVSVCVVIGLLAGTAWAAVGDFNGDGNVDSLDFDLFQACGSAPAVPYGPGCSAMDLDGDEDVDQVDFGTFQRGLGVLPDMALIPAGEFQMGDCMDPSDGSWNERPVHSVYVDAFYMDRYEVTNQQYADALNWAKDQGNLITVTNGKVYKYNSGLTYPYCDTTAQSTYTDTQITWNGSTFGVVAGKANHPMMEVSWYGSVAYANWRSAMQGRPLCYDLSTWNCNWGSGYRLPTEAEWEKAARGGTAGQRFPWGNEINHGYANYCANGSYYSYDTSPYTTWTYHPDFDDGGYPYTSPVGYFAANGYDLYDMVGNVYEWCNDWYDSHYYSSSPYNNPHGPTSGTYRVFRGGGWFSHATYCRVAARAFGNAPDLRSSNHGFRLSLDSP